jgi:hypothetical protein
MQITLSRTPEGGIDIAFDLEAQAATPEVQYELMMDAVTELQSQMLTVNEQIGID